MEFTIKNRLIRISLFSSLLCIGNAALATPTPNWSGVYIGAQAAYISTHTNWTFPFVDFYNVEENQGFSTRPQGGSLGARIGFNQECHSTVFGLEASYDGNLISNTRIGPVTPFYPDDMFKTEIQDLTTLTARIGRPINHWLFYARGGLASAHINLKAVSGDPLAGTIAKVGTTQRGWTTGVGLDYMLTEMMLVGLQYDFTQLNGKHMFAITTGTSPGNEVGIHLQNININTITFNLTFKTP